MLHLHSVSKSYGEKILFLDVNFTVGEKEKVGVMGRNGYGKSTFFRLISGEESTDEGRVEIPEKYEVRKLEQHLRFEKNTLLEQISSRLPAHEKNETWKAKSILMGLGFLEPDFEKSPFDFSSGYQIRIRLAEALVSECDLLLLDEPTNYLDIVSLRWLKSFLKNWNSAFLLITHDINFMTEVCSHSAIIHRGKIRKMKGSPQKLLQQIEKDEEVYEKTRVMDEKKQAKTEHFIKNFRAGARSAGLVQSRIKMLEKKGKREKLEKLPQIKFSFPAIPFSGDHLLRTHNITFGYSEKNLLIDKLSFEINAQDKIAVIGPNGKGKSTLIRLLSEKIMPFSGHLKKYHTLTSGYFGQEEENETWNEETVLSELLSISKVTETQARNVAASLLFTGGEVKKPIRNLSGGEKSRVRLGKLMLEKHHLLFLDEPSNHLDIESVQKLIEGLERFEGSLIIVSHDERLLSRLANKLLIFDSGKISLFDGGYQEFLEQKGWSHEEERNEKNEISKNTKEQENTPLHFEERKKLQKELRKVQKLQNTVSDTLKQLELERENLSFKMNKAIRSANSPLVAQIGKTIKEKEESIIQSEIIIEDAIVRELEIEELLSE